MLPLLNLRLLAGTAVTVLAVCTPHQERASLASPTAAVAPLPSVAKPTAPPMRYADAPPDAVPAIAPANPARKAKFTQLIPKLDSLFAKDVETNHYPGLAVGIVLDGEVVYAKGFGYRNLASKAPFDADTVFRIASVTKSFAAMAVLKLRDEGKLLLDDPAARYYSPLARLAYPTRDSAPITVRQLLTHGSGLPEDNYWVDAAGTVPDAKLVQLLESGMTFSRSPNTGFEYSNTGYALIGKIIERVSGMPARDYIRKEILQPLGMTASVFSSEAIARDRVALGYRGNDGYSGKDTGQNVASIEPLGIFETAGGLFSSVRDMSKYLAFHLSAWPPSDAAETGPLRRSSVREMHQGTRQGDTTYFPRSLLPSRPPFLFGLRDNVPAINAFSYGFGFFARTTCEDDFEVEHGGGLPGYSTALALYPKRGYGIILFINDERVKSDPDRAATTLLREAGVIDVLEPAPVPALEAARREVERLLRSWEVARAERLFEPTFWVYQSREKFQEQMRALATAHGQCRPDGALKVKNRSRGTWRMVCDRGEVTFAAVLTPQAPPRLQTLLWEDSLPPNVVLNRTGSAVAGWIDRWDDAAAKKLLAPMVDLNATRKMLARIRLDRGSCKLDQPLMSDGTTTARFRLACTEGAVELSITIDTKTGQITRLRSALPRTLPNCAL